MLVWVTAKAIWQLRFHFKGIVEGDGATSVSRGCDKILLMCLIEQMPSLLSVWAQTGPQSMRFSTDLQCPSTVSEYLAVLCLPAWPQSLTKTSRYTKEQIGEMWTDRWKIDNEEARFVLNIFLICAQTSSVPLFQETWDSSSGEAFMLWSKK